MGNTDYLFTCPNFLTGMGRVLDIKATTPYNFSPTPEEADQAR